MELPEGITRFSVSSGSILTAAASLAASVMLLQSVTADLVPDALRTYFSARLTKLSARFSSQLTLVIEESEGLTSNHMFEAANLFLGTKVSKATRRIKVIKPEKDEELIVTVDRNQEIVDFYNKVKMVWELKSTAIQQIGKGDRNGNSKTEQRYFELSFHNKYKDIVLRAYLPYILRKSKEIKQQSRAVRLNTVEYGGNWTSIVLNHPANFSTMAMSPEMKNEIIGDLDRFITRKDYYRRVGKAWKRGYLLYGPPGTGKSSLVAAMANYLNFDIYDLDLREVECNADLRRLLIGSANRSILVIEDIDCNAVLHSRESENQTAEGDKINLSGVLNLIDGLWSSCGDERIIVLTTNHKDRLDPALLRPGRMDKHIQMSYCTFSGFKVLASNYLRIEEHALYQKIEELLLKVKATPAEIAEELMKNDDADIALGNLIIFLQNKENTHSSNTT
nr:AAA-ATPase At3g50940-like [Ipomoea batatas]